MPTALAELRKGFCAVCALADLLMIVSLVGDFGSASSGERAPQTSSTEQTRYYLNPDELLRQLRQQLQPIKCDPPIRPLQTPAQVELAQAVPVRRN